MAFLVKFSGDAELNSGLGVKASVLDRLTQEDLPVPAWFVITTEAFDANLSRFDRDAIAEARSASTVADLVSRVHLNASIEEQLAEAVAKLCPDNEPVVVRASIAAEDSAAYAAAGRLPLFFTVAPCDVPKKVLAIWRASFSESVLIWRKTHGYPLAPTPPAVIVQRMVVPKSAGAAFGADLVTGRRSVDVVAAVFGMASSMTGGDCDADLFRVAHNHATVDRDIAEKKILHRPSTDSEAGLVAVAIPLTARHQPSIEDPQVLDIVNLLHRAQRIFETPLEIDWAIADDRLYLLSAKPIVGLERLSDPEAPLITWDRANLAELYDGPVCPLTASFARRAATMSARAFCRRVGVPESVLRRYDGVFQGLVAEVRGRLYSNVNHWYRIFALLPDYPLNVRYFGRVVSQMRGLPIRTETQLRPSLRDRIAGSPAAITMLWSGLFGPGSSTSFRSRINDVLTTMPTTFEASRIDELAGYYRRLEELVEGWDVPVVNDFSSMFLYAELRQRAEQWLGDKNGAITNDLLGKDMETAINSAVGWMRGLARQAAEDEFLTNILADGTSAEIRHAIRDRPAFAQALANVMTRFADRGVRELDFARLPLRDDPMPLLRSIGAMAVVLQSGQPLFEEAGDVVERIQDPVGQKLAGSVFRRKIFSWLLAQTRHRLWKRDAFAFDRARVFSRLRAVVTEMGRHLFAQRSIQSPTDIQFLEIGDILDYLEGRRNTPEFTERIELAKEALHGRQAGPEPAPRFDARMPLTDERVPEQVVVDAELDISGTGCCSGIVRGRIQVVSDPLQLSPAAGAIVVTTGPAALWVLFAPYARGFISEFGGQLSPLACACRQLQIPCILGAADAAHKLVTGDVVEIDGASGTVTFLAAAVGVERHGRKLLEAAEDYEHNEA